MDGISLVLLRTTTCTVVAAGLVMLWLGKDRVRAPAVHRICWVMVLLQGWAFFPLVFQLRQVSTETRSWKETTDAGGIGHAEAIDAAGANDVHTAAKPPRNSTTTVADWAAVIWAGGALLVALGYMKQYVSLLHRVPLGRAPSDVQWASEWDIVARQAGIAARTQFRLTEQTGPLCCFVPFFYLVLAPERLWCSLNRRQREAILRHELAHIARRDLWKSLAIRVLAIPQWFNPLAWKAVRAFDEAAEWACDDLVMGARDQVYETSYPSALLQIVQSRLEPLPGSVAARGGGLAIRIRRLVQPRFTEETKMTKMLVPTLLLGLIVAQSVRVEAVAAEQEKNRAQQLAKSGNANSTRANSTPEQQRDTRKEELARTGLRPYRVAPPDILQITSAPIFDQSRVENSLDGSFLVHPDGTVTLGELGRLHVDGMTVEEIQQGIAQKLAKSPSRRDLTVRVSHKNSKCFYVIFDGPAKDHVFRIPCTPDSTVGSVLATVTDPFPTIDYDEAHISVVRSRGADFETLTVDWKEASEGGDSTGNPKLLPGDRLFVTHPSASPARPAEAPVAVSPVATGRQSQHAGPRHDAKIPRAERFTFLGPEGSTLIDVPTAIAPSSAADRSPPPAPPRPLRATGENDNMSVKLCVELLDDRHGNLTEFKALKNGSMLLGDTDQISASLRILKKNQLIETLAAPTIVCQSGQKASLNFEGMQIETTALVHQGDGVFLGAKLRHPSATESKDVGAIVRRGQTIVVKATEEDNRYVVITPQLLRQHSL